MTRGILVALALILHGPAAQAHRIDDVLQSIFVRVEADRVILEWSATMAASRAPRWIRAIDADGDGKASEAETARFGVQVARKLRVKLDGRRLAFGSATSSIPPISILHDGDVPVRLVWELSMPPLGVGTHAVEVRNDYQPRASAFLANALLPEDSRVRVVRQRRDRRQRVLKVDLSVSEPASGAAPGVPGKPGSR